MRKFVLLATVAVSVAAGGAIVSNRAQAMPLAPAAIGAATESGSLVQDVKSRQHHTRHHGHGSRVRSDGAHLGGKAAGTSGMPIGGGTANSPGGVPSGH
jgi:hypothetical protein